MAVPASTSTVLRNTSGSNKTLALPIPPYTVRLGAGADYEYKGDLLAVLAVKNKRYHESLLAAIALGTYTIIQTPVVQRYDTTTTRVKEMNVDNNALQLSDPDQGSYGGLAPLQSYTGTFN